jgi:CPA2 family monovalent cation:H+ antiporter-2
MQIDLHAFLATLALVLCTAAVTTVVFQRLKQPVILGYLLAGLFVGPHVTLIPLVADKLTIEILAELGVILLLFGIGLEFSLRKLVRVGSAAFITGIIAISMIFWLGNGAARLLEWNTTEALFAGAAIAVSSTTIIAKAFEDRGIRGRLRDLVFGVLIVEDLVSILLLAGLSTVAAGQAASAGELASTAFRLLGLLSVVLIIGLFTIPRLMRWVISLGSKETTLVASVGLCFAGAYMAHAVGYSVALGAFIAGSLIAESGKGDAVHEMVLPVRDMFAAIFFVSVGMLIDPAIVVEYWPAVAVFTLLVIFGKVIAISVGAFLSGAGVRISMQAGMSMAQIGEFSFIIAAVGMTSPQVREFLYPVMVAVSAITTLITPWLIAAAPAASSFVDKKLPRPLQTFASLYATWLDNLGAAPRQRTMGQRARRMVRWLIIDAAGIAAVVIGTALYGPEIAVRSNAVLGLEANVLRIALIGSALIAVSPFLFGMARMASGLANLLATVALPRAGGFDRAAAPRRAFLITVEVLIVILVSLPLLAITQPFLPPLSGGLVLLALLLVMSVATWRSATNLEGHVAAGSQVLMEALRASLPPEQLTAEYQVETVDRLTTATHLLPGMGTPRRFVMEENFFAAGKTLAQVELRGKTGATVLAITRGETGIPAPSKAEQMLPGDQLVLVGSKAALDAAIELLEHGTTNGG